MSAHSNIIAASWQSGNELVLSGPLDLLRRLREEIDSGEIEVRNFPVVEGNRIARREGESLVLRDAEALSFLTDLPAEISNSASDSLLSIVECTKFLLELLCHGQFLPILVEGNSGQKITWEIAFGEESFKEKFGQLARTLPRILTTSMNSPEAFLQAFLTNGATTLIQIFARSDASLRDMIEFDSNDQNRAFFEALTGKEVSFSLNGTALRRLLQSFQTWGRNARITDAKPELVLHLKLKEPNAGLEDWELDSGLGIKAIPEDSLFTGEINSGNTLLFQQVGYTPGDLDEVLLQELAKAEKIFPAISRMMENRIVPIKLSTSEAFDLLTIQSTDLLRSGVVLELPQWWSANRPKLALNLKLSAPKPSRESVMGLNSLVNFEWALALDGNELTQDEFELLVKTKKPLVFLRGRWVELSAEKLAHTEKLLSPDSRSGEMRLIDALRRGANVDDESLPVLRIEADGWLKPLLSGLEGGIPQVEQPIEFKGELREYQKKGLDWLAFLSAAGIGGCLADDMGLGKTVQFLALLLHERKSRKVGPTLLVVPMSILGNWKRECEKFAPELRVMMHHGSTRLSGDAFREAASNSDVVLTTYALSYRDEDLLRTIVWNRVVLDEAQSIKNLNTKQSRSIRRLVDEQLTVIGRERPIERLALTGTPLENHLEELYSIFDFLNPGYLGSIGDFRKNISVPVERFRDRERAESLSQLIRPLMLRRLKSDPHVIADLPEKIEMDEFITLTQEQAALYQGVLDELLPQVEKLGGIHRKGLILSVLTRLKQICNDPALFLDESELKAGRSGKVERIRELLETILDEGDITLIFSQYAKMGGLLSKYLAETFNEEVLFLHGSLSRTARENLLKRFNEEKGPRIFVLSLKAGGYGLNLTRANQVIHFDQWWNPAVESQATDRAHRIGQTRTVQVRRLICQGTLEERISALSKEKKDLAEQIVGSTREYLTEMTTEDLKNLLELSVTALREDVA